MAVTVATSADIGAESASQTSVNAGEVLKKVCEHVTSSLAPRSVATCYRVPFHRALFAPSAFFPDFLCDVQLRLPHAMLLTVPAGFSAVAAAVQVS